MLRIRRTAVKTNETVLRTANGVREVLKSVKCQHLGYFGHILSGDRYHMSQLPVKVIEKAVGEGGDVRDRVGIPMALVAQVPNRYTETSKLIQRSVQMTHI